MAICGHLPGQLKRDLNDVATLNQTTHLLTTELNKDQAEILERAKAKYRQVGTHGTYSASCRYRVVYYNVCMCPSRIWAEYMVLVPGGT